MGEDYDRVVAAIPRMTPEERARIAARLKAVESLAPSGEFQTGRPPQHEPDDAAGELLSIIADVVLRRSGERVTPAVLRRSPQFRAFRAKALELAVFAAEHASARVQRRALLALGVELLYRDLRIGPGFSVTSRTLMACIHQVPAVLDKNFPGYASSGLLGMIIGDKVGASRGERR